MPKATKTKVVTTNVAIAPCTAYAQQEKERADREKERSDRLMAKLR